MSETRFTPGPWSVDGTGIGAKVRAADLRILVVRHRLPGDEHEANAQLIAAAPDLYAALAQACANLAAVSIYDGADDDDPDAISARAAWERDLSRFRAALSRARGEQP